MKHYVLTEKDMEICSRENQKNSWGFNERMLRYQLDKHRKAWVNLKGLDEGRHDKQIFKYERDIAMVEERLEDANFHTFCNLLSQHDYEDAKQWIRNEYRR